MKSKYVILTLSIVLASFTSAFAQLEVWINPSGSDGTGTGTAANPYVCSSESTFDTLIDGSAIPTNSTIHLMPGTFLTAGAMPLKPGWKLRGAGIDVTFIREINVGTNASAGFYVLGDPHGLALCNGVEVSDMTVDCNLQNQTASTEIGAVILMGAETKISRVKAINWGTDDGVEDFIFQIGVDVITGTSHPPQTNCLIEDCIVEQPAPVTFDNGADAFTIYGTPTDADQSNLGTNGWICGAEIRNCRIYNINTVNNGGLGKPAYFICTGIGNGVYGAKIDGNIVMNVAGSGVYESCGSVVNFSIENNMFIDIGSGIFFNSDDYCPGNTNSVKENISINNNFITVQSGGYGVAVSGIFGQTVTNVTVANNLVQATGGAGAINGLAVSSTVNLNAQNNVLDANGGTALAVATNVIVSQINNNQTLTGTSVSTSLWPVTNTAAFFVGDGSRLTGITAAQVNAAASTNALIWNSLTVTNTSATNWATFSVTPSNAVISVHGQNVAILQTNGVLNAYNGLSTTISNTAPATIVGILSPWTNTSPFTEVAYVTSESGGGNPNIYYNGSVLFSAGNFTYPLTIILQPGSSVAPSIGEIIMHLHPL